MSDTDRLLELIGQKSVVLTKVGLYVGSVDGRALIEMGEQRFSAAFLTSFVPAMSEPVHVWSVDGAWWMVGPTTGKPGIGVVATVSGGRVTVTTDFGSFSMPYVGDAPTSGNLVGISWPGPFCAGVLSTSPAAPPPPPDPGGGAATIKTATFQATDAGSTDRGSARWWTPQPWSSSSTYGAWFYGTQLKDTIPAGAEFVSLEFYVNRVAKNAGGIPRFALHNAFTKAGVPGFAAYSEWEPPNGWQVPPNAAGWFAALKAGGASAGVGLNQGGWSQYASLAQDGFSGALRIKWK